MGPMKPAQAKAAIVSATYAVAPVLPAPGLSARAVIAHVGVRTAGYMCAETLNA